MILASFLSSIKNHSVFKNLFALSLWQITNHLAPLLVIPYLIRTIGVDKYGVTALVQAVEYYFIILIDYGFGITAVRKITIASGNIENLRLAFNRTLFSKIFLCCLSLMILFGLLVLIPTFQGEAVTYLLAFFLVIGHALFPIWFFQGVQQMKFITYFNLVSKTIFVISVFFFISTKK